MKLTRLKARAARLKKFYYLYTSGLTHGEIERLLQKDTVEAFSYYKRKTALENRPQGKLSPSRIGFIVKEIFLSFVMQLTPARRAAYGAGVLFFFAGILAIDAVWVASGFLVVNILLAMELADKLTTRDELEIAREIQASLLPDSVPDMPHLSIAAFSRAARLVGGDFYDFVICREGKVHVILGDVSGKGIPAALYAAHLQSLFESQGEVTSSPAKLLERLDNHMSRRLREGDFVTAAVASFAANDRSVVLARAGHNWPLLYSTRDKTVTALKPRGISLGLNIEAAGQPEEQRIDLDPGDILLIYSDGITEASDPQGRLFDQQRLEKALQEQAGGSPEQIIDGIMGRVNAFSRSDELDDDATMVAVKVLP